jgi:2-oxoglutarate ferredoxin oxidoreductase subunit alpha
VTTPNSGAQHGSVTELDRVTIRFAGDSGDGMQLTGSQFTATTALFGNDVSTLPFGIPDQLLERRHPYPGRSS